jgi:hypothetical protein
LKIAELSERVIDEPDTELWFDGDRLIRLRASAWRHVTPYDAPRGITTGPTAIAIEQVYFVGT